jgi:hypothetical protein
MIYIYIIQAAAPPSSALLVDDIAVAGDAGSRSVFVR